MYCFWPIDELAQLDRDGDMFRALKVALADTVGERSLARYPNKKLGVSYVHEMGPWCIRIVYAYEVDLS